MLGKYLTLLNTEILKKYKAAYAIQQTSTGITVIMWIVKNSQELVSISALVVGTVILEYHV